MSSPTPFDPTDYDLDDTTIYQWRIWKPERNLFGAIFLLMFMALAIPAMPFGILYAISFMSLSTAVYVAWVAVGIAVFTVGVLLYISFTGTREERIKNATGLFSTATFTLGAVHFLLTFDEPATWTGFKGAGGATVWTWGVFLFDNFLGVVLLDIPDVYNWHLSAIRPESQFACFLTVVIRVLITIGLVEMILAMYRTELSEQELFGTVRECAHFCDAIIGPKDLVLSRTGKVESATDPPAVKVTEFLEAMSPKLKKS